MAFDPTKYKLCLLIIYVTIYFLQAIKKVKSAQKCFLGPHVEHVEVLQFFLGEKEEVFSPVKSLIMQ